MINIRSILKLNNNDGLTLKAGKPITYKTGWQVATEGVECKTAKSHRVNTKREALEVGKAHNQISVLGWRNMALAYC